MSSAANSCSYLARVISNIHYVITRSCVERKRYFLCIVDYSSSKYDPRQNPMLDLCVHRRFYSAITAEGVRRLREANLTQLPHAFSLIHAPHVDVLYINHGYNDFWYLKRFMEHCQHGNTIHKPNLITIRYNPHIPGTISVAVPYTRRPALQASDAYHSSSLRAIQSILTNDYIYIGDTNSELSHWIRSTSHYSSLFVQPNIEQYLGTPMWKTLQRRFWVSVLPQK